METCYQRFELLCVMEHLLTFRSFRRAVDSSDRRAYDQDCMMPQCSLSPTGTHRYVPSPVTLSSVQCLYCCHEKLCTKSNCASKYLRYRRTMQHSQRLQNITVSLEGASICSLNEVLTEVGVVKSQQAQSGNRPAFSFVTLLEGLYPDHSFYNEENEFVPCIVDHELLASQIEEVRAAIQDFPRLTVRKLHKIRRSDRVSDLLIADVSLHPNINAKLRAIEDSCNCILPQYPKHIPLGTVSREGKNSVNILKTIRKVLQGRSLVIQGASLMTRPFGTHPKVSPTIESQNHSIVPYTRVCNVEEVSKQNYRNGVARFDSSDPDQPLFVPDTAASFNDQDKDKSEIDIDREASEMPMVNDSISKVGNGMFAVAASTFEHLSPAGRNFTMNEEDMVCDLSFLNTPSGSKDGEVLGRINSCSNASMHTLNVSANRNAASILRLPSLFDCVRETVF